MGSIHPCQRDPRRWRVAGSATGQPGGGALTTGACLNGIPWRPIWWPWTREDIAILARKGVHVVHNPGSNLILGSGVMPLPQMLAAGVQPVPWVPTGGQQQHPGYLERDEPAATRTKAFGGDATVVSPQQALAMATGAARRAMGQGGYPGSLEAGQAADLILVDLD